MRNSFVVRYWLPNRPVTYVLGVTSIVPNLDGVLMFVENGNHHQVEHYEMVDDCLPGMSIDYDTSCVDFEDDARIVDGRNK